jgi:hypothetical protein
VRVLETIPYRYSDSLINQGIGLDAVVLFGAAPITTTYTVTVDDASVFGPFDAGLTPPLVDVEFTGRKLRFDVDSSTGGNTGAVEIEVYGK